MINWVRDVGNSLPSEPDYPEIPEVAQIDELQTYVGKKKQNMGLDCCKQELSGDFSLGCEEIGLLKHLSRYGRLFGDGNVFFM